MLNPSEAALAPKTKNPRRVAAGIINGSRRRPWDKQDRERLRQQCLNRKPWLKSTGPRTDEGKYRSRANGCGHLPNPKSLRQIWASLTDVNGMMAQMAELRRSIGG
jgi:hypothetical protein